MLTLIMWHNRVSENKNEAVEAHIPRHRDSKTKKPRHRDSKTKKPRHREMETINPRHRDSKTFFQRTKSHDIEIPRLKNHDIKIPRLKSPDIEFLWNSDPMPLDSFLRRFYFTGGLRFQFGQIDRSEICTEVSFTSPELM